MTDQKFDEKDEKYEKDDEKDEKERGKQEEKTIEEKWRRDPLGTILWAVILIWAGLVFLADSFNLLDTLSIPGSMTGVSTFTIVLFGAGIILFIGVIIRLIIPSYRQPIGGTVFLAVLFIGISLGNVYNWRFIGAFIIIAIGVSILLRGLMRRKE